MKRSESDRGKAWGWGLQVVDVDLLAQASCSLQGPASLRSAAPGFSCLPAPPSPSTFHCWPVMSFVNLGLRGARGLRGSLTFALGTEPPGLCGDLFPPAGSWGPREAVWEPRRGARTSEEGGSRVPGLAFVALKTFQRACHGDAQRPSRTHAAAPPAGNFLPLAAVSLSLSDAPPPGPLSARPRPPSWRGRSPRRRSGRAQPGPADGGGAPLRRRLPAPPRVALPDGPAPARALTAGGRGARRQPRAAGSGAGREEGTRRERPEEAAGADFSPMVQRDMSKSPPSAAAAAAPELRMDVLESAAPAGALGAAAAAQVATAPRLRLRLRLRLPL